MAWNAHQAVTDPLHLFDANLLYPHREAMALAGHRMLLGLLFGPVIALTDSPVLAANLAAFAGLALAAWAGRRLALVLGLAPVGAWTCGALYAFHTFQINEVPRADLLYHGFTTLALVELLGYLRHGERRRAWRVALLMLLQGLASNYLLLYGALLLGLVVLAAVVVRPRLAARRMPGLALPAVAAALLFLPVILPHVRSSRTYGFAREAPTGIDLKNYLSTQPTNVVYGAIFGPVRPQQRGPHFVGFLALALCGAALILARRDEGPSDALLRPRDWVPAAAAFAVLLVVLSLGKDIVVFGADLGPGPYRLLHAYVPGFAFIRIPERLAFLAMLFVALLAGYTISRLEQVRALPALLLAALVPLEHLSPIPLQERVPVGREVPEVYRWLATHPVRALAEVPNPGEGLVRRETIEEYFSIWHFRPIVHGYVSYPPLLSAMLRRMALDFPSQASLQAFERVGVDTVVVHRGRKGGRELERYVDAATTAGKLVRAAHFEGRVYDGTADEVYRLAPVKPLVAAPMPGGRRLLDPSWHYAAKAGEPRLAADGDLATSWYVPGELLGDETWEVSFDRPVTISGIVIPLRRESCFPTRLRLEARTAEGSWRRLARLDEPHLMQLVDQLLAHPGWAELGFDLPGREVFGVRLMAAEEATGFDGWAIPEIEIRVP